MERREALPFLRLPRPLLEDAGASRRSIAAFIAARAALSAGAQAPTVSELLAPGSSCPGGGVPAPPGCVECVSPRARAPHPIPPSRRLMRAPSVDRTALG